MTSDDITDFISTLPDVPSNWSLIIDHLKDAADEIDRLNSKASNLESALAQPDMLAEAVELTSDEQLKCPPTEWEISDLINVCKNAGAMDCAMMIRRLAFQRDMLKLDNDRLNACAAKLESFARELWEHDKVNVHIEADGAFPGDYCDWCRGMIAKAKELGIEEANDDE